MGFFEKSSRIELFSLVVIILLITISLFPSCVGVKYSTNTSRGVRFYYTYNQFTDLIEHLQEEHPDIFDYYSLGKTYEGRDIWLVKISDNVTINEDESEVLFMGGTHGDEKPAYQAVIYSMKAIVENYTSPNVNYSFTTRIRNIVNTTELFFIPMVNPDGIEAQTRKNRRINDCILGKTVFRGVDINRNYGYKWEELDNHPLRYIYGSFPFPLKTTVKYPFFDFKSIIREGSYRGSSPFSESESRAVKQFIENSSIAIRIDYHTSGEKILYPWSWTKDSPDDDPLFISIAENISKINGYQITQGSNWYYILGNSGDWMYAEHGILPFTIELCKSGFMHYFPIKSKILEICKTHLLVNLYIAERVLML